MSFAQVPSSAERKGGVSHSPHTSHPAKHAGHHTQGTHLWRASPPCARSQTRRGCRYSPPARACPRLHADGREQGTQVVSERVSCPPPLVGYAAPPIHCTSHLADTAGDQAACPPPPQPSS